MAAERNQQCFNIGYDILTIMISVADVTTDIIVLMDFYYKDRMTFFWISLSILIFAQCAYSIAFAIKFETFDQWSEATACCCCLCLIPFGTFIAFCFYFADKDGGIQWFKRLFADRLNLFIGDEIYQNSSHNKMTQWINSKLNKHLGFLLESVIEAFPQSLLQIVAIVYYQEANYVSIVSIILSMFSVMSKSLILSQGIDKYTFIWTWIAVVTDFFGIFFTLTWVFYTNENIEQHEMFGGIEFNIFGVIWIWKYMISVLSMVITGCILFWGFGYWLMAVLALHEEGCADACLWCFVSPILCIMVAFATCLGAEVLCFSIFAVGLYRFSTARIHGWRDESMTRIVHWMLDFIFEGKDRRLRILAINYNMYQQNNEKCKNVYTLIEKTSPSPSKRFDELKGITYKDMRGHDGNIMISALKTILKKACEYKEQIDTDEAWDCFHFSSAFVVYTLIAFIFGPILMISKIIQILFPWFIIGYLVYNDLFFSNKIASFQMAMLCTYIGLQLIVILLGIHVFKIHWYLLHIDPSDVSKRVARSTWVYWDDINSAKLMMETIKWYTSVCWYPLIETIVLNKFGNDIGEVIINYWICIKLEEDYTEQSKNV